MKGPLGCDRDGHLDRAAGVFGFGVFHDGVNRALFDNPAVRHDDHATAGFRPP